MNRLSAFAPIAITAVLLCAVLSLDPFRFQAPPPKTTNLADDPKASRLLINPHTQETTHGDHPLDSLHSLESDWRESNVDARFVLLGNSQTYTILLSPQERVSPEEEPTYPDILMELLHQSGRRVRGYRLSAPNISYMEVLWYVHYLLTRQALKPKELIVQVNFETFRKTGIRDGMLELLNDPEFAAAVEAEARSNRPYAGTFQQAIDRYHSQRAKEKGVDNGSATKTGLADAHGFGAILETKTREILDRSALFRSRTTMKGELLNDLYLGRVYLLGIKPTTKRSLGGGTLTINVSSLERVGELCRLNGISLAIFNAPQNPLVPLYRTERDHTSYEQMVKDLASRNGWQYFDFENCIPKEMWGVWIDGPDPIHFGRAAHRRLAEMMLSSGLVAKL